MTSLPLSRDYATSKFDLLVEIVLSLSHTHKVKRRSGHRSTHILCIFYTYARCPIGTEAQQPALRCPRGRQGRWAMATESVRLGRCIVEAEAPPRQDDEQRLITFALTHPWDTAAMTSSNTKPWLGRSGPKHRTSSDGATPTLRTSLFSQHGLTSSRALIATPTEFLQEYTMRARLGV